MGHLKIEIIIVCFISHALASSHSVWKTWGKLQVTDYGMSADCPSGNISLPDTYRYLQVVDCSLTTLSADIFQGDCIGLYLSNKGIQKVDGSFNLPELEELDLSYNNISEFATYAFGYLYKLRYLDLSSNGIKSISANSFESLSNLYLISFKNNEISSLPENLFYSQRSSLKIIDFSSNHLTEIGETFGNLTKLTHLFLEHNNISEILPNSFQGLTSLHYLDISYNRLGNFPYGVFNGLESLRYLNFSDNRFTEFPFHISFYLGDLSEMNFRNNAISLDAKLFVEKFRALLKVDIRGIGQSCEELADIMEQLQKKNIGFYKGYDFNEYNIMGIRCSNENKKMREKNDVSTTEAVVIHASHDPGESAAISSEMDTNSTETGISMIMFVTIALLMSIIVALLAFLLYVSIKTNKAVRCQDTLLGLK